MKKLWIWVATAAIVVGFAASPAQADDDGDDSSGIASLTGESLLTSELPFNPGTLEVDGECTPDGESTYTFTASGVATGPYPGTFTESGTIVIGAFGIPPFGFAAVSFESAFRIDSPAGTVTGTKTLGEFAPTSLALCGPAALEPPALADAMRFEGRVAYTATITTLSGSATDNGTSFVDIGDARVRGLPDFNGFIFSESYVSTSLVPDSGSCEDDDCDDDGEDDGVSAG